MQDRQSHEISRWQLDFGNARPFRTHSLPPLAPIAALRLSSPAAPPLHRHCTTLFPPPVRLVASQPHSNGTHSAILKFCFGVLIVSGDRYSYESILETSKACVGVGVVEKVIETQVSMGPRKDQVARRQEQDRVISLPHACASASRRLRRNKGRPNARREKNTPKRGPSGGEGEKARAGAGSGSEGDNVRQPQALAVPSSVKNCGCQY